LAGLAAAYAAGNDALPSLRLVHLRDLRHPMSIDLWIDKCACHAKIIVVRLLGGLDWWRYGVEALGAVARDKGIALAVLPGEDRDDARLDDASTLPPDELAALLAYFREGGAENLHALLRRLAAHAGESLAAPDPSPVPRMDGYLPASGAVTLGRLAATLAPGRPVVPSCSIARRCLPRTPIDALCEALLARGLAPAPFVEPQDRAASDFVRDALLRLAPAVIVTTTAFAAGGDGEAGLRRHRRAGGPGGDRHHAPRRLAGEPARAWPG
jgi:cobaltochelatase CobN